MKKEMQFINEYELIEYIRSKRILDFLQTRTKSEKDMFSMALSYHQAYIINSDLKMGREISERDKEYLEIFKELEVKYQFNYLEVSEEYIEQTKDNLMQDGVFVRE